MKNLHWHYLLTCQSGLESLVKKECERIGLTDIHAQDRLVKCTGNEKNMYELLSWGRFANRVYISLAQKEVATFDSLYELAKNIQWTSYLTGKERIVIEASSTRSTLSSVPTLQSISQKAIFSTLRTPNLTNGTEVHILILIIDNIAHILLDITGDPLHKRGYRHDAGEAPIKENLAAALIAFSGWRYKTPLLDPFCGSGTIVIEAALMARNIAPGLSRHFRIESLPCYNAPLMQSVRDEAKTKSYQSGQYQIRAQDIDPNMIDIARKNAERAGVLSDIEFHVSDFLSSGEIQSTIVTNPPYGNRLKQENLHELSTKLIHAVDKYGGGFITSYPVDIRHGLSNKKLLNGGEECRFWYKKNM